MTVISSEMVKTLRDMSGAGVMKCKRALEETGGDLAAAETLLRTRGQADAASRAGRAAHEGQVGSYVHVGGKIGVLIEINCETDFVARSPEFARLLRDLAMQVAGYSPEYASVAAIPPKILRAKRAELRRDPALAGISRTARKAVVEGQLKTWLAATVLSEQPFRDGATTVGELVADLAAKTGENISVRRFVRFELGE